MNIVDSFLLASACAYFFCAFLPKNTIKTTGDPSTQKMIEMTAFLMVGVLILLNTFILNINLLWAIMGGLWVIACCITYLGYIKWNVLWKEEASDEAQIAMWAWDLLIALCCFLKFTL